MSKTILCKHIQPEFCEKNYGTYCTITKSGLSKGECAKIKGGPILQGVQPNHLIDYKDSKSNNSKNSKAAAAAAVAAAKAEADRLAKAEADRKRKEAEAERKRKEAERKEAAAEAERKEEDDADIIRQIEEMEASEAKKGKTKEVLEAEEKELQEAVLSAQTQLAASRGNSCLNMPFYENTHLSCYMDSVIFALMAFPSPFLNLFILNPQISNIIDMKLQGKHNKSDISKVVKYVEKIQRIINKIDSEITVKKRSGKKTTRYLNSLSVENVNSVPVKECRSLRLELLKEPFRVLLPQDVIEKDRVNEQDRIYSFGDKTQEDVAEFLQALFDTFFIFNVTQTITIKYASSTQPSKTKIPTSESTKIKPIIQIPMNRAADYFRTGIISGVEYKETLTNGNLVRGNSNSNNAMNPIFDDKTTTFDYAVPKGLENQFVVLQLNRFNNGREKITTPVIPSQTIRLNEGSAELQLNNIIVHVGDTIKSGHYVAYFKCNDNWYLYNDMDDRIERIGTYEELLEHRILNSSKTGFRYKGKVKNNAYLLFYSINDQRV
jgi:ubiquitin C-terminal hydrolase